MMNTAALAYIGDAVYEVYIRMHVLSESSNNLDKLNKMVIKYVRAEGQAVALKKIFDSLTPYEQALVKRARNKKTTSKPQNADPVTYKLATAFEALVGYLYLSEEKERLESIIKEVIDIISEVDTEYVRRRQEQGPKK